ncbi:MAG: hypothetical protein ACM3ZT_00745 [Bacillota bacterium]
MDLKRLKVTVLGLRKYASFFEWPDKQTKELGIVESLHEALDENEVGWFGNLDIGPGSYKAPDCVAHTQSKKLIAIEVTELVSKEAIEINQNAKSEYKRVYKNWKVPEVADELRSRLLEKDKKRYYGGPYSDVVIVIHTDELTIDYETYKVALNEVSFGPFENITKAYLLFSYAPRVGYCPYIELNLRK